MHVLEEPNSKNKQTHKQKKPPKLYIWKVHCFDVMFLSRLWAFALMQTSFIFIGSLLFCFLGPHMWHMEVSRLGVESELQLMAYTTAHGKDRI